MNEKYFGFVSTITSFGRVQFRADFLKKKLCKPTRLLKIFKRLGNGALSACMMTPMVVGVDLDVVTVMPYFAKQKTC